MAQWSGPSKYSVLCSQQFDSSCFESDSELASQMGIQKRRKLKDDAIPTLRDLDPRLKCHTCLRLILAQVALFHEREHQVAHLWLMQVAQRR